MKAPDEYYHIYNRGVLKTKIFRAERDWIRFLFNILHFQSDYTFSNPERQVDYFVRHRMFNIEADTLAHISNNRNVELTAYTLMPNHFHLILKNCRENGIEKYTQRLLNSYTKYVNIKYKQGGHLFQSGYQSVHIEDDTQLLHLSAYIHKHASNWSSLNDYLKGNRWGDLLKTNLILEQFTDAKEYAEWLKENPAKEPEYLQE